MAETFYSILTSIGKAKIANAAGLGTKIDFVKMKVGDGNGSYYNPTEGQADLVHTVWQGNINQVAIDEDNPNWINIEVLIPPSDGGFFIREYGVFDSDGNMLAIAKCAETYKPLPSDGGTKEITMKMVLAISNTSSVTLKIDPTVIFAKKSEVEIVQNQVNSIKSEVENARGTYENLEARLDHGDSQLSQITKDKFKLASNIDSTDYKANQYIDIDYIRTRQIFLYGQLYKKFRDSITASVCCMGDSTTYGYDVSSSDIRPADSTPCPDGSINTYTRASKTYPEALKENLTPIFGADKISVTTRGFCGDTTEWAYPRWNAKHSADVTIIMYGINDAIAGHNPDRGDLEAYLQWYEQLIVREILWDKAVILLSPIKQKSAISTMVDVYANSLIALGEKYNVPVIQADDFFANYGSDIFSDDIHPNGKGYTVFGAKVASLLIGEGCLHPMNVFSGTKLLTRPTLDNIKYFGSAQFSGDSSVGTPAEIAPSNGMYASLTNGGVIYSIYTATDDLICIPIVYRASGKSIKVELDFSISQPDYSIDIALNKSISFSDKSNSSIMINDSASLPSNNINDFASLAIDNANRYIHIAKAGWHTIKISSTDTSNVALWGVMFIDFQTLYNKSMIDKIKNTYVNQTHSSYAYPATSLAQTRISFQKIRESLGIPTGTNEYYKTVPLKITVYNYLKNIISYVFTQGDEGNGSSGWNFISSPINTLEINSSETQQRTISNISYDSTTKELVITWGGDLTRVATYSITVL